MAIPISMPNSEDADDNYRSLDLLLEQLLMTLRQVIMHRRREAAASSGQNNNRQRRRVRRSSPPPATDVPEEEQDETHTHHTVPIPNLPDLVLDASSDCGLINRQRRRKDQMRETERPAPPPQPSSTSQNNWVQVGAELRRIADRFRANNLDQDETDSKETRMKDASLLSILCPPFGGSVWTTVALLIGWGLLSRTR